jgi:hypothetical protein
MLPQVTNELAGEKSDQEGEEPNAMRTTLKNGSLPSSGSEAVLL